MIFKRLRGNPWAFFIWIDFINFSNHISNAFQAEYNVKLLLAEAEFHNWKKSFPWHPGMVWQKAELQTLRAFVTLAILK